MNKFLRWLLRVSSLQNNYLSLLIVAVLFTALSYGQAKPPAYDSTVTRQVQFSYGFEQGNMKFGTIIIGLDTPKMAVRDSGALAYINPSLYAWTGYIWKQSSGSGGIITGPGVDSITWNPPYLCSWVENFQTCYNLAFRDTTIFAEPLHVVKKEESGAAHDTVKIQGSPIVGQVLTSNGLEFPVTWQTPSGGGISNEDYDSSSVNFDGTKYIFYNEGTAVDSVPIKASVNLATTNLLQTDANRRYNANNQNLSFVNLQSLQFTTAPGPVAKFSFNGTLWVGRYADPVAPYTYIDSNTIRFAKAQLYESFMQSGNNGSFNFYPNGVLSASVGNHSVSAATGYFTKIKSGDWYLFNYEPLTLQGGNYGGVGPVVPSIVFKTEFNNNLDRMIIYDNGLGGTNYPNGPPISLVPIDGNVIIGGTSASDKQRVILNVPTTTSATIPAPRVTTAQMTVIPTGVLTGNVTVAGTGYTQGSYKGVPLTGGTGSNATVNINVASDGTVNSPIAIINPGGNYTVGDVLSSAAIGPGTGFTFVITSLTGVSGMLAFNTDSSSYFQWNGTAWQNLYGGGSGGGGGGSGSWTVASGKTPVVNNSIILNGADGVTYTLPGTGTTATIARTDIGQYFSGNNRFITNSTTIGGYYPYLPFIANSVQYSAGTAAQSGTAITGTGTTWTSAMVGSYLSYSAGNAGTLITGFTDATHLTGATSQTIADQAYAISVIGIGVSTAGNVGIGITNPAKKLIITSAVTDDGIQITNTLGSTTTMQMLLSGSTSGTVSGGTFEGKIAAGNTNNFVIGTSNANPLRFFTNNAVKMSILGTGEVGIGISTPTAYLHFKAGVAAVGGAPVKFSAGPVLTTASDGAVEFDGTNYFVTSGGVRYILTRTLTGTAAPATTPAAVGIQYVDTTNKKVYVATGTASSADWTILN